MINKFISSTIILNLNLRTSYEHTYDLNIC